jgi:transcriptional regulator with XRE-family HTH domain
MNLATLRTLAAVAGKNQSDLARMAGVSRQAVSLWFDRKTETLDIRSRHLQRLAEGMGVAADVLLSELPGLAARDRRQLRAELLWDRVYPDLDHFLAALVRDEPRALGRFVQVCGLYRSGAILGPVVWTGFPAYARFIHPGRRRGLEALWRWRQTQTN